MAQKFSARDKEILLQTAREAVDAAVEGDELPAIDVESHSSILKSKGVSFVTLTRNGRLRGCIGAMEPYQALILDVQDHAAAAATRDFRFPPVCRDELPEIKIEISRLTPLVPLKFCSTDEIIDQLHPHVDGVLIKTGGRRATFLPQVWEKVPDPEQFLNQLCLKMGASPDHWRSGLVDIYTYQVENFEEQ